MRRSVATSNHGCMESRAGRLVMTWWTDGDGTGRLTVAAVSSTGFGGRSRAWFNNDTVLDFAGRLQAYPLPSDDPPLLSGGTRIGGEPLVQVGIRAYPVGSLGQVALGLELATEPWDSPSMRPSEHEHAQFELLTSYERLSRFGHALRLLVIGNRSEAELLEERLAGSH